MAVPLFYLNRQYAMEKKIAYLEKEKNALLLRDYRLLKDTYAANAKMFHDFHNHMDVLYRYLEKGRTAEAVRYLESLRSPVEAVTQPVWTGDEAADYLINSKTALAASRKIKVKCNIEYPQHTNIRSVDLVAILGNLLDNALEAGARRHSGGSKSLQHDRDELFLCRFPIFNNEGSGIAYFQVCRFPVSSDIFFPKIPPLFQKLNGG